MSKSELKQVKKNLKLSANLHEYLMDHPAELDKLPKGATIVFDKSSLNDADSKKVYHAVKKGDKWDLIPA